MNDLCYAETTPAPRQVTPRRRGLGRLTHLLIACLVVCGPALATWLAQGARATAEEDGAARTTASAKDLRLAGQPDADLAARLAAVERILAADELGTPADALHAASTLLGVAAEPACWLLARSLDADWPGQEALGRVSKLLATARDASPSGSSARGDLGAALFLTGVRDDGAAATLLTGNAPSPFVLAVLRRDVGSVLAPNGGDLAAAVTAPDFAERLGAQLPYLRRLDEAQVDDPKVARPALDALLKAGASAVPLLLHEVAQAADDFQPGRRGRATRAILALGLIQDRRATDVLIRALQSADGWIRTYAATALGDLGDPASVVALVRQMTILGDPLRPLDQWDYPGASNINIKEADWRNASYYLVDTLAADACLRLGVRGAAGWLIENQLDPRKKNFRIRVLQDATDALRRSVPGVPVQEWNVDSGLPRREKAFRGLVAWWWEHRDDEQVLRSELSPTDPRLLPATLGLADVLSGASGVREMMMAKAAIRVLGPLMTPALAARAKDAQSPLHRAEIAQSLGLVRDPQAVPVLMQLIRDKAAFVRANATQSLGPYADGNPQVRDLLLLSIKSKRAGLRLAAMNALVHLRAQPEVVTALDVWLQADAARVEAGKPTWRTPDVVRALTVIQLVQHGEAHWPAVRTGLRNTQRVLRRTWWDLLRGALQLPDHLHDPVTRPGDPHARQLGDAQALAALKARRS